MAHSVYNNKLTVSRFSQDTCLSQNSFPQLTNDMNYNNMRRVA